MSRQRLFPHVPRRLLSLATIIGGVIGIVLSQLLLWTALEGFFFTLIIAFGCVLLTVLVYNALQRRK